MPDAMAAQNRRRSSRPATGGRPGDHNGGRPDRAECRFPLVIATPSLRLLRRPVEFTFYAFLALVVLLVAITDRLLRSRFGRAFLAIKDNEIAAAAMGIPTDRYIVLAFAWGGAVVGVGGAMFAISVGHLTPVSFDLTELIRQFAIIMVGGLASLTGAIIGAAIITAAPQVFASFPGFDELVFGLLIVLVILFLPRGLASLLARLHPAFVERYYRG